MAGFKVRKAVKEDCKEIMAMIMELAIFEKMPEQVKTTEEQLIKDGFESEPPCFRSLIAELDGKNIGYALYFYSYSTFEGGMKLYLEDLFIREQYRGSGYGRQLFQAVQDIAKRDDCFCMQWCVLNWNEKALGFYKKLGAFDLTLDKGIHMWRFEKHTMTKLAS